MKFLTLFSAVTLFAGAAYASAVPDLDGMLQHVGVGEFSRSS